VSDGAAALDGVASDLGVPLTAVQVSSLLAYRDLLVRWNQTYNLTAVRDADAMLSQHLFDCLALLPSLSRERPRGGLVLDVGSGGGLPGVVIAIAAPSWRVRCVDAVAKKAAFVRQVAAELSLSNLDAVHDRVEALPAVGADVVTSRAFATLADFVSLTRRHLAEDGVWLAMKGRQPDVEVAALPPTVSVFHVEPLSVPGLDAQRCLVWMRPTETAIPSPIT
jgi:16S rRNA (guanine527-N7)-methyltransferase